MVYIADLHVHSHYSRATSRDLNLESLYQWARIKGIHVVGTGDFTHPAWFKEIREKLEPDGSGLFRLKNPPADAGLPGLSVHDIDVRFCLTTEISSIYKYGDKVRKNHNLVYAPDFETVTRINTKLAAIGNLESDGRPILGLPSRDLLEIVLGASPKAYLIPAHVWTPWFSTLGSKGGYDSVDECFRDLSGQLFAIETGLSSDPVMNRKWSALDRFTLISNSDAHSPQKLGREANIFNTERSYDGLFDALKTRKGFMGTYEFFPEEGKYFHDGHRACGVSLRPDESAHYKGRCPVCGEPLTIGVLNRVEELIDRREVEGAGHGRGSQGSDAAAAGSMGEDGFRYIIPLPEILAEIKGTGPASKGVMQAFQEAIATFGNEFSLLNEVPVEDIQRRGNAVLAEAIRRMRQQEIRPVAGYDGVYGVIKVFEEGELKKLTGQLHMFGDMGPAAVKKGRMTDGELPESGVDGRAEGRVGGGAEREAIGPARPGEVTLNEAQAKVSAQVSGALLVKAGPGTGKTSTLVRWIAGQIVPRGSASRRTQQQTDDAADGDRVKPEEVMAITFTNKAAREIKDRLAGLIGDGAMKVRIGTFHAIAYQLLQEYEPHLHKVYDEQCRRVVLGMLFPELKETDSKKICEGLEELFEGRGSSGGRGDAEGQSAKGQTVAGIKLTAEMQKYASRYRAYLESQGAVDLSDILGRVIRKWEEAPALLEGSRGAIRALAIDEVQDINPQQYQFFRLLGMGKDKNLLAIGDPDQAIYGFRGSDTKLFFQLEKDLQVTALTDNYRCPGLILEAAGRVIENNIFKSGIALQATRPRGGRIRLFQAEDPAAEARYIIREIERLVGGFHLLTGGATNHQGHYAFSDIAILVRTHSVGRELLAYVKKSNIPVHLADGSSFLSEPPFSLVADVLRLYLDGRDSVSLSGVLQRGLGYNSQKVRNLLSVLHTRGTDWKDEVPELGRFFVQFEEALDNKGLEEGVREIFRQYLPMDKLSEEHQVKKESILLLAKEARERGDGGAMPAEGAGAGRGREIIRKFLEEALLNRYTDIRREQAYGIHLLTLHAAKGLEFPVVFIAGAEEGVLPSHREGADPEEERRLFYVGMTRAKEQLYITYSSMRKLYGKEQTQEMSRLVREIPEELIETARPAAKAKAKPKEGEGQMTMF